MTVFVLPIVLLVLLPLCGAALVVSATLRPAPAGLADVVDR